MSPLPVALPPFDVATPTGTHAAVTTGPGPSSRTLARERSWDAYTVQQGDTLYDIAEAHGTTISALLARNDLDQGGRWLTPGQQLRVPGTRSSSPEPAPAGAGRGSGRTVTVRPGDTLSQIARQQGVPVGGLASANGIQNVRLIYPGQRLALPGARSAPPGPVAPPGPAAPIPAAPRPAGPVDTVTVRSGDTLSHIAARHGVSLDDLLEANSALDPRRLWVGQKVSVPAGTTGSRDSARPAPGSLSAPWSADTIGDRMADQEVPDSFLHYTYSSAVARSAAANREYLAAVPVPDRARTKSLITDTARRHGVDPQLMLALSRQESGWSQRAVSPANAIGVMQVIPSSGEWASQLVGRELNLLDPRDNVTAGTVIMRALLRSAGTEAEAIGGYYQGLASVQRHGLFSDTKHYVASIRALRERR